MEWSAPLRTLHLTGWVQAPDGPYWLILEGLRRAEVAAGTGWLALDLDETRLLLAPRRTVSGPFSMAVHGQISGAPVHLLTASGARVTIYVPNEREGPP